MRRRTVTPAQVEQSIDDPEHGRDGHPRDVQARNQRGSAETQSSDNIASRRSGIRQDDAGTIMAKLPRTNEPQETLRRLTPETEPVRCREKQQSTDARCPMKFGVLSAHAKCTQLPSAVPSQSEPFQQNNRRKWWRCRTKRPAERSSEIKLALSRDEWARPVEGRDSKPWGNHRTRRESGGDRRLH